MCILCKGLYHYACLNMTTEYYLANHHELKKYWKCPTCDNVNTRQRRDDTPVRSLHKSLNPVLDMSLDDMAQNVLSDPIASKQLEYRPAVSTPDDSSDNISLKKFEMLLDDKLSKITVDITNKFGSIINELKKEFTETTDFLDKQISDLRTDITAMNLRMTSLSEENERLKAQFSKPNNDVAEVVQLKECVEGLRLDLNDRDQDELQCELEITGVPEFPGESAMHIILTSAQVKLGVELKDGDVVRAARVGRRSEGAAARPRPLVVRLAGVPLRDRLLREARVRRNLTTADLGLPEHRPVAMYFNERLTKYNRVLFAKARDMGQKAGWKFVWTKGGRVYARHSASPTSLTQRLRSQHELSRIFNISCSTQNL